MEAKELRIGNYVYLPINDNEQFQVEQSDFCSDNIADYSVVEFCKPIPLTEEWLLKFGATKTPYEDDSNDYYCVIRHDYFSVFHEEGFAYLDICEVIIKLEYVHKLQNIWYALTGEELTTKE
jgi:hypothetical protein